MNSQHSVATPRQWRRTFKTFYNVLIDGNKQKWNTIHSNSRSTIIIIFFFFENFEPICQICFQLVWTRRKQLTNETNEWRYRSDSEVKTILA